VKAITKLQRAIEMRDSWIVAEEAVQAGQSYSVDGKTVTKANLSEIRNAIKYWEGQISQSKRKSKGKGRVRITNVVPTD